VPVLGWRKPLIALKSVVFPEPFGPISPTMPFAGTEKLTLRKTVRPPK